MALPSGDEPFWELLLLPPVEVLELVEPGA
jgi:hypothetical protein